MNLLLLFLFLAYSAAYKIVLIAPGFINSQIMFNKRVGEALANAGHDVTVAILQQLEGLDISAVKFPNNVKTRIVNVSIGVGMKEMEEKQALMTFNDLQLYDKRMRDLLALGWKLQSHSCRLLLKNKEFLSWLEESKFDVAFVHMYNACPVGLPHLAKIPAWVWLNSGALMDFVADLVGVPLFPSYVPPILMAAQDEMTFFERTKSFVGHILTKIIWPRTVANPETQIYREEIDPAFPDLLEIAANCSLVMVNSNPLYDLPRPTLAKIVNIGGLGAHLKDAKPLPEDLEKFIQKGEAAVVFSFGSAAPIHKAPESWKDAILKAFARLPQYQFVMRYMGDDLDGRLPPNLKIMKWLPQSDLLQHPRVRGFISHGGYNGMQETIAAGKPIIMIPLSGDQPKNAKIGEKHGIAKILLKTDLNEENLVAAIQEVLTDPSYAASARRLSQMVARQPISASEQLVRWTEFLAEFRTLDNLRPAGQKLNFFQYFSLDVIGLLLAAVFLSLFLIFALLKCVIRRLFCSKKRVVPPKEEHKKKHQ